MNKLATYIDVDADYDYGDGWLAIQWDDPPEGREGLKIDLDGHCSRNMPIRSGQGPPDFELIGPDRLIIRFQKDLARKLELDETLEVRFAATDDQYNRIRAFVNYWMADSE
jgi:hypothetical protein